MSSKWKMIESSMKNTIYMKTKNPNSTFRDLKKGNDDGYTVSIVGVPNNPKDIPTEWWNVTVLKWNKTNDPVVLEEGLNITIEDIREFSRKSDAFKFAKRIMKEETYV